MDNGSVTNQLNESNMQINDYSREIIFLRDNKYQAESYTNDGYDSVTLSKGTLMGRVTADGEIIPLASGASDGSQIPVGILTKDHTVSAGDTVTVNICTGGEVAEEKVVLDGSDTMDTMISGRTIRDRIQGDTTGIQLVSGTNLTAADNS